MSRLITIKTGITGYLQRRHVNEVASRDMSVDSDWPKDRKDGPLHDSQRIKSVAWRGGCDMGQARHGRGSPPCHGAGPGEQTMMHEFTGARCGQGQVEMVNIGIMGGPGQAGLKWT